MNRNLKSILKLILVVLITALVTFPLAYFFNYYEDIVVDSIPKKFKIYGFVLISFLSAGIATHLFGKYEDKLQSTIFKRIKFFDLRKRQDSHSKGWLAKKTIRLLNGKCFNCNHVSLAPINHELNKKGITICENCQKVNKVNLFYQGGLVMLHLLFAFFLTKTFSLYLSESFNIHWRVTLIVFIALSFTLYAITVRKIEINSDYDLTE